MEVMANFEGKVKLFYKILLYNIFFFSILGRSDVFLIFITTLKYEILLQSAAFALLSFIRMHFATVTANEKYPKRCKLYVLLTFKVPQYMPIIIY